MHQKMYKQAQIKFSNAAVVQTRLELIICCFQLHIG